MLRASTRALSHRPPPRMGTHVIRSLNPAIAARRCSDNGSGINNSNSTSKARRSSVTSPSVRTAPPQIAGQGQSHDKKRSRGRSLITRRAASITLDNVDGMLLGVRVLHVIPDIAVSPEHRLLGSTKDVRGRTEYFQTAGINYDELPVVRLDRSLRTALDRVALERYDVVFIELAQYPRSMKWLAKKVPDTVRIVRPTNASSLQHLHLRSEER